MQALVAMKKDREVSVVESTIANGMQTLIGDAKLAESHVRSAASFFHRNGTATANRIAVKSASIHHVQVVRHHGLVAKGNICTTI